jgi:hypothetical protein
MSAAAGQRANIDARIISAETAKLLTKAYGKTARSMALSA